MKEDGRRQKHLLQCCIKPTRSVLFLSVCGGFRLFSKDRDRTDSPATDDDDDDHSDEKDQASCCWADDERQLLLNTGVVFLYKKKTHTHTHAHKHESRTHRLTSWDIWKSIWASAYGGSNGWQTGIRPGRPMSILASTGCGDHFPKHTDCVQMRWVRTNHLAQSVWSERREYVWVRSRAIWQPRGGIQLLDGQTRQTQVLLQHHKRHTDLLFGDFIGMLSVCWPINQSGAFFLLFCIILNLIFYIIIL